MTTTATYQNYIQAKQRSGGAVLLMRIGDFYEAYGEDAETISRVLVLALTTRQDRKMAGFPYHQRWAYTERLEQAGVRVVFVDRNGEVLE